MLCCTVLYCQVLVYSLILSSVGIQSHSSKLYHLAIPVRVLPLEEVRHRQRRPEDDHVAADDHEQRGEVVALYV